MKGTQAAGNPGGSVTFTWCKESQPGTPCTGTTGGGTAGTNTVIPNGVDPTWPSKSVTPGSPGTYCFNAAYSATQGGNYASVAQQSDNECFTVDPAGTKTSTQQSITEGSITIGAVGSVTDTATVTGNQANGAPTGRVTYWLCWFPSGGDQLCPTGTGLQLGWVNLQKSSSDTSQATTVPYSALNAVGTYCFSAAYTPAEGSNYAASTDNITGTVDKNECFTVNPADPGFSTQQSGSDSGQGSVNVGSPITDTATVTGNSIGGAPTGTVTFYVCGPSQAPSTCAGGDQVGSEPVTLTASGSDTSTATSVDFTPTETGTYCFAAVYTPDEGANYNKATENQSGDVDVNECFLVTKADFRVLKTDQPGNGKSVAPGATVPYTVQIQNIGDGPGSATVTDTLPSNLTIQGTPKCAVTSPDTCAVANTTGSTWTFTVDLAAARRGDGDLRRRCVAYGHDRRGQHRHHHPGGV